MDVARGLAVIGMFGAHIGWVGDVQWEPRTWLGLVYGRPSILFAVLAGVSLALLSGRHRPVQGDELVRARLRILVRAAWIFAIGGLLAALDTFVSVILGVYAVLFVLALPFLRWPPRRLFALAGVLSLVAPAADLFLRQLVAANDSAGTPFSWLMLTGPYPAVIWIAFVLVGIGVGRLDLAATAIRVRLLLAGLVLVVVGYGGGWLTTRYVADGESSTGPVEGQDWLGTWDWTWLSGAAPHSGTTFEMVGSTGVALAVLAACLLAAEVASAPLYPIAAVGMMPLTIYSGQVVAIWLFIDRDAISSNGPWLLFTLLSVVAAVLIRWLYGQGPLERLLSWSAARATSRRPPVAPADEPVGDPAEASADGARPGPADA